MASIRREIHVAATPGLVWDALRDVGRIHERLVRGFVTDCHLDGDTRVVTFGNGMTVRERIVDIDDAQRRVVWSVVGAPFTHHNASVQAFDDGTDRTRLVWIADLLPDELETQIGGMIDQGMAAMKRTLEQSAAAAA
ncbi:SRPBCC family protein [Lysobacter sp. CFH 32150]|uniref:SRPBCC family protein n=1 Tax=Lysobacter sp. CFH 32150 TaxID=2927128 RepID=UPI001FA7BE40|nr:SRPBCC family protein [Lysobacter sp. CFH 32150]MCI4568465.1 SRPBCC family protein [Lysobacter sp. CFH 32150]